MIHRLHYFAERQGALPRLLVMLAFAIALGISWWGWQFLRHRPRVTQPAPARFSGIRTVDDPMSVFAKSVDLMGAPDFAFSMRDGGRFGSDTIKISADGKCRYVFLDHSDRGWRRGEFVIDQTTLSDLRKLLVEIDFFRLKIEYDDAGVADGTQRLAWVQASGMQKRIYCSNYFPPPFEKLYNFVQEKVILRHSQELQKAPVIDPQEARQAGARTY